MKEGRKTSGKGESGSEEHGMEEEPRTAQCWRRRQPPHCSRQEPAQDGRHAQAMPCRRETLVNARGAAVAQAGDFEGGSDERHL